MEGYERATVEMLDGTSLIFWLPITYELMEEAQLQGMKIAFHKVTVNNFLIYKEVKKVGLFGVKSKEV
jgi:hypothetical protein